MNRARKTLLIMTSLVLMLGQSAALDINSSTALNYYNNDILDFQVDTSGQINAQNNLNMNGNSITNYFGSSCPTGEVVADVENNGNFGCVNVTSEVQDTYVNRAGDTMQGTLDMNSNTLTDTTGTLTLGGGNIEITTGNLDMNDNIINGLNQIEAESGRNLQIDTAGGGGNSIVLYDNANSQQILNAQEGGKVEIPNGNLDMQTNNLVLENNQVSGQDVSFDGSSGTGLRAANSNGYVSFTPLNSGWAHIYTDRSEFIFNKPVHTTANEFASYDNSLVLRDRNSGNTLTVGSSIQTSTNLNMNGYSITNYFGGACNSGNVVNHINDDGSIDCIDATGEVQDDFVTRTGDTMSGSLGMGSNPINNVGSGNIDIGDGSGDINMNGQRIYGSSLGHFQEGGISGTLSNTQNNLDTLSANSFYVAGDVKVGGDFVGTGGDVAENVKTFGDQELEPGTVTTITGDVEVDASTKARDTAVAGVVSTDPGVRLAEEREGVPLALTGIVPVKTTVENGEIEPGDLLTTSDKEGYAMRCKDSLDCHGAIIGKAMGSLDETGRVEALVTLG